MPSLLASLLIIVALFTPSAIRAPAQQEKDTAPRPEIRGVVVEPGVEIPVIEADVTLEVYGETRLAQSRPNSTLTAKADSLGAFVFHPDDFGQFTVRARKDGYSDLLPFPGVVEASSQNVSLTAATPSREVRLFLARPSQLSGHVVIEETGQPVAGVRLGAIRVRSRGVYLPTRLAEGVSDGEGKFALGNLAPGDYVVEILPRKLSGERVLSSFSEEDVKTVDQDFEHSYWPGGAGLEVASPISLLSGSAADVGLLRVRTTGYYRVHVRFLGRNCEEGDVTKVFENRRTGRFSGMAPLADAPCGKDLLITGFPSGTNRLMFGLRTRQGEITGGAAVPFEITDENLKITALFERPITVNGTVVAAEGSKLPNPSAVSVRLSPASNMLIMDLVAPVKADFAGKFHLQALPVEPHRLAVSGAGPAFYVQEVRYNGSRVAENIVPLNTSALAQELTIVLDDKPAVIAGTVMKNGKPVGRPVLILAKWPLPSDEFSLLSSLVIGDDKGRFQIGGLAPGEYRLIAATREGLSAMEGPDKLRRALPSAQKIELGVRETQDVTLELTELR